MAPPTGHSNGYANKTVLADSPISIRVVYEEGCKDVGNSPW